jgi:hypothetical protein
MTRAALRFDPVCRRKLKTEMSRKLPALKAFLRVF